MRSLISRWTSSPEVTPDAVPRSNDRRISGCPASTSSPSLASSSATVPGSGARMRAAPESSARKPSTRSRRAYSPQIENATSAAAKASASVVKIHSGTGLRERHFAEQLFALRVDRFLPEE